jgi:hypothetical protein
VNSARGTGVPSTVRLRRAALGFGRLGLLVHRRYTPNA